MEAKLEKEVLSEIVQQLRHIYGSSMDVAAVTCCVNGSELTGVIGQVPDRRIVPVVYLRDIPAGLSVEKAVDTITRKFHAMLTGKPVKPAQRPPENDRQAVLAEVVLQVAGRKAARLMLHDNVHLSQGGITGLFYLRTRKTYLAKDELKALDISMDELLSAACRNTLAQFGVILANTAEFAPSLPVDTILQSEPFASVHFDPQSLYLLTSDAPAGGAALMLMPPVLELLGRIVGDDYYITPTSTREVMVSSAGSMFSPKILAALLQNENQKVKETPEEGVLSDYIYRYDCTAKRLMTIQQ